MSEHLALRSSAGNRSSALPPYHQPPPHPDPLTSVWIRRLHLIPNQPPPPPPRPRPPPPLAPLLPRQHQDAVSTDESRTQQQPPPPPPRMAGFGPFRWSPRPLRGAPLGAWDAVNSAVAAPAIGGRGRGSPPMLSPFFRLPAPPPPPPPPAIADFEDFAPAVPPIGLGNSSDSGVFSGSSSRMIVGAGPHAARFAMGATGAAYPSHAVNMRTLHDIHNRQASVTPKNFASRAPSSGNQHDEPVSYWDIWRFRRNTITSSISPTGLAHGNLGKKRNADSSNFLPLNLKFRKA